MGAKGSKSKTDQELWKELENTYPLEPENKAKGFYDSIPILRFGDRVRATEDTGKESENRRREFVREDGNIGIQLRKEVRVTPEQIVNNPLRSMNNKQIRGFKKNNDKFLKSLYQDTNILCSPVDHTKLQTKPILEQKPSSLDPKKCMKSIKCANCAHFLLNCKGK